MQAFTRSVFDLFTSKRRYLVPMFQRPYVWGLEKQWEPLWEDIRDKAEEHFETTQAVDPHFMGAIVINQIPTFGASIPAHELIDGQQRLTTFQIFLAAFRDLSRAFGEEEIAQELDGNTVNYGKKALPEEDFKVWPTRADQDAFTRCMKAKSRVALEAIYPPSYSRGKLQPRHKMVDAYLFFYQSLHTFVSESNGPKSQDRIQALFNALQNSLQLVSIELESRDDPQVIFESLNARGEPLLSSDLLRNFIFLRAKREGANVNAVYAKYWEHFDTDPSEDESFVAPFWKIEVQQSRFLRPRLDLFIQHFLSLKTGKGVNVSRLFHEYRNWIETDKPYRSVEEELEEINRYSRVFAGFFSPSKTKLIGRFLLRFQRLLDTNTVFPLLLFLEADSGLADDERAQVLRDIESYMVRRIVCGLTDKAYNGLFLELLRSLRHLPKITATNFRETLLSFKGESRYWPGDEEFHRAWIDQPIYRSAKSLARIEAMLLAIEESDSNNDRGERIDIISALTIEHIMPQTWEESWPLPAPIDSADARSRREKLLHTFGNLTLLTQRLNSSVSNGPYANKRPAIAQQSRLSLNTYFQTCQTWDEDAIRTRGEVLFKAARRTWPFPTMEGRFDTRSDDA